MKITYVDFIAPVSFGGQIRSATSKSVVGDRPGQTPMEIDFDGEYVKITKIVNGKSKSKFVPMTNVSSFEVEPDEPKDAKKVEPKK